MLATELLFACIYCLVDDAIKAGVLLIPRRPGPAPDCTDAELLCVALARHLLRRRSENGFLAEIRRDCPGLFPHLPASAWAALAAAQATGWSPCVLATQGAEHVPQRGPR